MSVRPYREKNHSHDHACFCVCLSFGSIVHIGEKTCGLCVSEPGLLHLTLCPPIVSISLQTTCNYSLWASDTLL
jgi:hypothetical protein